MSCIEVSVEPVQKRQNGAVMANCKLLEVLEIFVDGESMSLSGAKWQVHHLLANRHPTNLEQSLAAAPEKWRVSMCSPMP